MKNMKILMVLIVCFILGLLVCTVGCDTNQRVGSYILARQCYDPGEQNWPVVVEYTHSTGFNSKSFLVFIKDDQIFVVEGAK